MPLATMRSLLVLACLGALAAPPVQAAEPTAALKLFSGSAVRADYYGSGSLKLTKALCVASDTGAFRLRVVLGNDMAALGKTGDAVLRLKMASGEEISRPLAAGETTFQGRNDLEDRACARGPNAELAVVLPETALTAMPAGSYFDMMQLFVDPI